jgi:hypothetical protein
VAVPAPDPGHGPVRGPALSYFDERRQQDAVTRGHLERLGATFQVRIVCERLDVLLRQANAVKKNMRSLGGQHAMTALIAGLHEGRCRDCGIEIGWHDEIPYEPLKVCPHCARKAIRPGTIMPVRSAAQIRVQAMGRRAGKTR